MPLIRPHDPNHIDRHWDPINPMRNPYDWTYPRDDFARRFLQGINESDLLSPQSASPRLCETCTTLSRCLSLSTSFSELSKSSESCELCKMLFQCYEDFRTPDEGNIWVFRDGPVLMNYDKKPILVLSLTVSGL